MAKAAVNRLSGSKRIIQLAKKAIFFMGRLLLDSIEGKVLKLGLSTLHETKEQLIFIVKS
jgi:hypothetical protein